MDYSYYKPNKIFLINSFSATVKSVCSVSLLTRQDYIFIKQNPVYGLKCCGFRSVISAREK